MSISGAAAGPALYVWRHRVMYVGPSYEARSRKYGSAALVAGLDAPLTFNLPGGGQVKTPLALLPPQLPTFFGAHQSRIAVLFLDMFRQDYFKLADCFPSEEESIRTGLEREESVCALFRAIADKGLAGAGGPSALFSLLGLPANPLAGAGESMDPRILQAIKLMTEASPQCLGTSELASRLHLSIPRVIQLFRDQLGMSFGAFQRWYRLHLVTLAVSTGQTLTDAAQTAGFVDLAHYDNLFKRTFGVAPSIFLSSRARVEVDASLLPPEHQPAQSRPSMVPG
ncbi:AraC family transcriptional regulator [Marinobacter halodurans]|uniref:AraC family transcriptional regulator n=1 Tax=Marinobacter halodurans TaxID=2528979 RepID=A0ABY1ZQM5_9GAMM|nr:helix-turn-helix domain-containing protein [Marinobacter halodurans]TBW57634.1 AraC family transcriptional regulator [Marinobacter halodurans]